MITILLFLLRYIYFVDIIIFFVNFLFLTLISDKLIIKNTITSIIYIYIYIYIYQ